MLENTLVIIKPDAVKKRVIGAILSKFEVAGLHIVAAKMHRLTTQEAEQFYHAHRNKSFFPSYINFMVSGPICIVVLSGYGAVKLSRELIGATDPANAASGTIRSIYAESKEINAVHGSDSVESAQAEIALFFDKSDMLVVNEEIVPE